MSDIYAVKLPGFSLFLCEQAFKATQAFVHVFCGDAADIYLSGVRFTYVTSPPKKPGTQEHI